MNIYRISFYCVKIPWIKIHEPVFQGMSREKAEKSNIERDIMRWIKCNKK